MAMIAMTTSNSMSVKAWARHEEARPTGGFDSGALKQSSPLMPVTMPSVLIEYLRWMFRRSKDKDGGRERIRTSGRIAPTPDFESGAFNHSATLPSVNQSEGYFARLWVRGKLICHCLHLFHRTFGSFPRGIAS